MAFASLKQTQRLQVALIIVFVLPLLAHMLNGQFARMLADDYCFTDNAVKLGWWGAMQYQYAQWSGTYSSTAVQAGVAALGATALRWLPLLLLAVWLAGMIWTVYEFGLLTGIGSPRFVALFIGSLVVFATVEGASNIFQSLYWRSGSATYVTPLALMSVYSGYILHLIRRPPQGVKLALAILVSVVMTFIVGGFSPIVAPLQVVLLLMAITAVWRFVPPETKRAALTVLLTGVISAMIALIILVAAPGNSVRQAQFRPSPSLPMLAVITLWSAASFMSTSMLIFSPVGIVIALVFPGLTAYALQPLDAKTQFFIKKNGLRLLLVSGLVGFGLFLVCFVITAYSISDIPPARAMIVPQFILVHMTLFWGVVMGLSLQKGAPRLGRLPLVAVGLLVVLLVLGPIRSTVNTIALMPVFNTFASEWDARDNAIQTAVANGTTELTISPFTVDLAKYVGVKTLDAKAHVGFNACAESYYGLKKLVVK